MYLCFDLLAAGIFLSEPLSEYFLLGLFKSLNYTGVMSNLVISL